MLPRKYRLTKRKDFEALFRHGRSFSTKEFSLKFGRNGLTDTRVAVSVSKKFSKKAVERNAARRKVREIFRLNFACIKQGFDILFVARIPMRGMTYHEISALLLTAFKNARLL